jgi:hypothetical protein
MAMQAWQDGKYNDIEVDTYGDAAGEVGFGFFCKTGVYFEPWNKDERASHTLGEQFTSVRGKQSSTLQEGKCLLAAALCWLEREFRPPGSIFVYGTDSMNLVHLANKMRSATPAVNRVWAALGEAFHKARVQIHVVWKSRDNHYAKCADALSRCNLQAFQQMQTEYPSTRFDIPPSIRQRIMV